ncbi:MAG: hypothetical protein ACK5XN_37115 [Bacteroidota bacterium]
MSKLTVVLISLFGLCSLKAWSQVTSDTVLYQKQDEGLAILHGKLAPIKDEKQFISAQMLQWYGCARLSDIIPLIDKMASATYNGDRHWISINATSTFQQQNLLVFINGKKTELERWNALHLNLLGINIADVAYIEVVHTPQLFNGILVTQGAINIVTRNDVKGFHANVFIHNGNPINDPGAARYIPGYQSPNVDRMGGVTSLSTGYNGNKWHINFSASEQRWYARDTSFTKNRIILANDSNVFNQIQTLRAEGAFQSGKTLYSFHAGYSHANDFAFLPFNQFEIPARVTFYEASVGLTHAFSKQKILRGRYTYNGIETDRINNKQFPFQQHNYEHYYANMEYVFLPLGEKTKELIAGFNLDASTYQPESMFVRFNPYLGLTQQKSKKVQYQYTLGVNILNNTVLPQLVYKHTKKKYEITSRKIILTYFADNIIANTNQLWYFNGINTSPSTFTTGFYGADFGSKISHHVMGDYYYILSMSSNFKLTLHAGLRYVFNQTSVVPTGNIIPFLNYGYQTNAITADVFSVVRGINLHYDVIKNFLLDIDYYAATQQSKSEQMQVVLNHQPTHKLLITSTINLPARFDLSIRNVYTTATDWFTSNSNAVQTQQAMVITDVFLNKKLWENHLNINLGMRNLFNQKEQFMPIGATFPMRFFLSIKANFGYQPVGKKVKKLP